MTALLFQTENANLLLGFIPDAAGLLVFGVALIVLAASLRWFFNRKQAISADEFSESIHRTVN